jgi:hydrogenase maturation protein HypF
MSSPDPPVVQRRIRVRGTVQGVGFRPFVYRVATGLGLDGTVRNVGGEVLIEAVGPAEVLDALAEAVRAQAPGPAVVREVTVMPLRHAAVTGGGFAVVDSATGRAEGDLPVDLATCEDCLRELFDPSDRRFRYPFINCTACGPRATIVDDLPYDRARTAMAPFRLCPACAAEYRDPENRRFHAEPVACPRCGPALAWTGPAGSARAEEALAAAVDLIARGGIVALKGLGGYQLVCDATDLAAVSALRARKHRPRKPLAVMVADRAAAAAVGRLTEADAALLTSPARPIVLVGARAGEGLADGVHPGVGRVGLFLPYTPLHHLLLRTLARPLVVTSGNRADEPIAIDDADARTRLTGVADGFLSHDRDIRARYDDSVTRTVDGAEAVIRRARGYAPAPLRLPVPARLRVLAVGAQLKHTFALATGERALVGPHGGDLADADSLDAFEAGVARLSRLHRFTPEVVAHDLHPGYLSTRYAHTTFPRLAKVAVQHHHAHVVSCAAEHDLAGPFLGVAYDGLGLGDDGTLWGGEILLADYSGFRRLARFARAPLPGGEAAVRRPARMALGYLHGLEDSATTLHAPPAFLARLRPGEATTVEAMIDRGLNTPRASSAGRLFDAVASLLGVCDDAGYEGEAAVMLETLAARGGPGGGLPWRVVESDGLWVYDCGPTLAGLVDAVAGGANPADLAAAFHRTVVTVTVALCARAAESTGVRDVCLSGGCLQNGLLATWLPAALTGAGLTPYLNRQVPANDGGISYGQAVVAAARTEKER